MRYLVRARVRTGSEDALLDAIGHETLGRGSVAEGEYLRNMREARIGADGLVRWVEVCYCPTPLEEEQPYWEEYFQLLRVQDAHDRRRCRDYNGSEPWACEGCDCTARLEAKLQKSAGSFIEQLQYALRLSAFVPAQEPGPDRSSTQPPLLAPWAGSAAQSQPITGEREP